MKQFLRGRLYASDKGYDYYIPPTQDIGKLYKAIANDLLGDDTKLIFLQNYKGNITFGVREPLTLTDFRNRIRCNFMGYQLEEHESFLNIPFYDAFQAQFSAITREAHECHYALDRDSSCGKIMREASITFGTGHFQESIAWDKAVRAIQDNPSLSVVMMFDERGNALPLSIDYSDCNPTLPPLEQEKPPANNESDFFPLDRSSDIFHQSYSRESDISPAEEGSTIMPLFKDAHESRICAVSVWEKLKSILRHHSPTPKDHSREPS